MGRGIFGSDDLAHVFERQVGQLPLGLHVRRPHKSSSEKVFPQFGKFAEFVRLGAVCVIAGK